MNILITGGAGYIGSHIVKELLSTKHRVIVYDNLSKGHQGAVAGGSFVQGDLTDKVLLDSTFKEYAVDAVIHMAADSLVGESMEKPAKYYGNNLVNGLNLLEVMGQNGVTKLVFSSTAAVYGEPEVTPITEAMAEVPTNVYGRTKLMFEGILKDYDQAYGLKFISLRYFNASGADAGGKIGEDHQPESHLIPLVLQTALGFREQITVFGTDYPTSDGTCVRDYIHVTDLAQAHILALEALEKGVSSNFYNLGNGQGFSVLEVIKTAQKISGHTIKTVLASRRPGDPAVLIASSQKIIKELGWQPRFDSLDKIIETAWQWHQGHPKGFDEGVRE